MGRTFISSTPITCDRKAPRRFSPPPIMAVRFQLLSGATISPAPNSIRKKARPRGSPFSNASCIGDREEGRVILFPAIDLKDGNCVRLRQGDMAQATIFNHDAAAQAHAFQEAGFEWLHVVDLNGAFAGHSVNKEIILSIISAVNIPVQLGGGVRDLDAITFWIEAGIARVILGTAAVRSEE